MPSCTLKISDLSISVHLGCSHQERASFQEIRISFEILMPKPPRACHSDQLSDTICYAQLCETIRNYCAQSEFHTIERLAMGCFELLKSKVPSSRKIRISAHKVKPPVDSLEGGVYFEIETENTS